MYHVSYNHILNHVSSSPSGICIIAVGVSELIVEVGQTEAAAATGIDIYEYNPLHNILYSINLDMSLFLWQKCTERFNAIALIVSDLLMNTKLYSGQRTLNISVKSLKIRYFTKGI